MSLILIYVILVFISYGINDIDSESDDIKYASRILVYIELAIIIIFVFEITANVLGYGWKVKLIF